LDAVRDASGGPDIRQAAQVWLAMASRLDMPDDVGNPAARPVANPPLDARPDSLSVTDIAILQKDPYAIYAKYVLRLRARDPIDADPGAKERGTLIHAVLESFNKDYPAIWPDDALSLLLEKGRRIFAEAHDHP